MIPYSEHLRTVQSKMASLKKTRFVWGSAHSEWGSEGAVAGAKVRYNIMSQLEVHDDAPQLDICCPTLHGAAPDATYLFPTRPNRGDTLG